MNRSILWKMIVMVSITLAITFLVVADIMNHEPTEIGEKKSLATKENPKVQTKAAQPSERKSVDTDEKHEATSEVPPSDTKKSATLAAILANTEGKLYALQGECAGHLSGLYQSFKATRDSQKRQQLIASGYAKLSNCDGQFSNIIGQMSIQLKTIAVDSAPYAAKYQKTYQATKQSAMSQLIK